MTKPDIPPAHGAKQECEQLMGQLLPFAETMLAEHGEFLPFGGVLKMAGEMAHIGAWDDAEAPLSRELIALLKDGFIAGARSGQYKATALLYNASTTPPGATDSTEAVVISLNHRDGYSVVVVFPYTVIEGCVEFGDGFAQAGENDIFPQRSESNPLPWQRVTSWLRR
ncbi:MAG: hypothetical protein ACJ8LG_17760 [Massilia sp.]